VAGRALDGNIPDGGVPDRGVPGRHDVGPRQRLAVLLVAGLADLAVGLFARDLLPGPCHLDGGHDGPDDGRGDNHVDHGVQDRADDRADDQERDQDANPDGGDLEPAHPPLPL
jgi:hypothetical protein